MCHNTQKHTQIIPKYVVSIWMWLHPEQGISVTNDTSKHSERTAHLQPQKPLSNSKITVSPSHYLILLNLPQTREETRSWVSEDRDLLPLVQFSLAGSNWFELNIKLATMLNDFDMGALGGSTLCRAQICQHD